MKKNLLIACFVSLGLAACQGESKSSTIPTETTPPPATTNATASSGSANADNRLKIDFEHFGSYDLTSSPKTPAKINDTEGDVVTETVEYQKDGVTVVVETAQSEYTSGVKHILKGSDGKVQKTHSADFVNETLELTESVNDYTMKPAKKFSRIQKLDKPWQQLNPMPLTATGNWAESAADELQN